MTELSDERIAEIAGKIRDDCRWSDGCVFDAAILNEKAHDFARAVIAADRALRGWQPIETAPKDGTYILVGNAAGSWVAKYLPVFQSGFKPDNPWASMMLNHDHLPDWQSSNPTHWMPLPAPPSD